jgi:hypothetical protein
VGVLWEDEREENCIANPSRIEILDLVHGYKAPCRHGLSCTRKSRGCKFDHGDRGDVCSVQPREGGGSARTDGVRQLSGQRAKDSDPGDEMVADECKAS